MAGAMSGTRCIMAWAGEGEVFVRKHASPRKLLTHSSK